MLHEISYIVLDAARMGGKMNTAKVLNPVHDSLYRGGSEEKLACVAPYLFSFTNSGKFNDWFLDNGWGDSWGMLIKSAYPMSELHKHFRKFLIVGTEDKQQLYFRFYDPRVLRIFLPTCDVEQLTEFFGPIEYFLMEDEDPGLALKCSFHNHQLRSEKVQMSNLLGRYMPVAGSAATPSSDAASSAEQITQPKRSFFNLNETTTKPQPQISPQAHSIPSTPSIPVIPSTPADAETFAISEIAAKTPRRTFLSAAEPVAQAPSPAIPGTGSIPGLGFIPNAALSPGKVAINEESKIAPSHSPLGINNLPVASALITNTPGANQAASMGNNPPSLPEHAARAENEVQKMTPRRSILGLNEPQVPATANPVINNALHKGTPIPTPPDVVAASRNETEKTARRSFFNTNREQSLIPPEHKNPTQDGKTDIQATEPSEDKQPTGRRFFGNTPPGSPKTDNAPTAEQGKEEQQETYPEKSEKPRRKFFLD